MTTLESRHNPLRLIFVPALISLSVTLLRLIGELSHWSERWFSSTATRFLLPGLILLGLSSILDIVKMVLLRTVLFSLALFVELDFRETLAPCTES